MFIRCQGFSLIELIIALSLSVVILCFAVPSFTHFRHRYTALAEADKLIALIRLARFEAITRNQTVTLCPSDDGEQCSYDWSDGQLVFVDSNSNGRYEAGKTIIKYQGKMKSKLRFQSFPSSHYLRMSAFGFTLYQNGSFILCPTNTDAHYAHAVFISQTGQLHTSRDADGDGIEEDSNGQPLICVP